MESTFAWQQVMHQRVSLSLATTSSSPKSLQAIASPIPTPPADNHENDFKARISLHANSSRELVLLSKLIDRAGQLWRLRGRLL